MSKQEIREAAAASYNKTQSLVPFDMAADTHYRMIIKKLNAAPPKNIYDSSPGLKSGEFLLDYIFSYHIKKTIYLPYRNRASEQVKEDFCLFTGSSFSSSRGFNSNVSFTMGDKRIRLAYILYSKLFLAFFLNILPAFVILFINSVLSYFIRHYTHRWSPPLLRYRSQQTPSENNLYPASHTTAACGGYTDAKFMTKAQK